MINQLQPAQISLLWPSIKESIQRSSPLPRERSYPYLNHVLEGLLSGMYQCWVLHETVEEEKQIYGVLISSLTKHKLYGHSSLYVDHMYAFRQWSRELIQEMFTALKEFAKACECEDIIAETNNQKAYGIARNLGFDKLTTKVQYIL